MSEGAMDEMRMVEMSGRRGDPEPSPDVVERHRSELRAAIRSAGPATTAGGSGPAGVPDGVDPDPAVGDLVERRRRRAPGGGRLVQAAAAAAAVVVLVGAVALVEGGGNDADERVAAAGPQGDRAEPPICGRDLPVDVVLPDGFRGPEEGPAGDGGSAPGRGQHVVHWTSDRGAVEVRWPADPDRSNTGASVRGYKDGAGNMVTSTVVTEVSPSAGGRMAKEMVAWLGDAPSEGCAAVQVTVSAADRATVEATADHLITHLFDRYLPALVVDSRPVEEAPPVSPCQAPAGMAVPPNKGGQVTGFGSYPSPEAALEAFLATKPGLSRRGYQELLLAGGSITFAYEPSDGFFSTVVKAVPTGEGWTVVAWEASGC